MEDQSKKTTSPKATATTRKAKSPSVSDIVIYHPSRREKTSSNLRSKTYPAIVSIVAETEEGDKRFTVNYFSEKGATVSENCSLKDKDWNGKKGVISLK